MFSFTFFQKISNFNKFFFISSNCAKDKVSEEAKNKEVSEWLWKLSEKWTSLDGSSDQKKK